MEPFECNGCGQCCGPVPVSKSELKKIQKKVKSLPSKIKERVKNQVRDSMTCMFRDMDSGKCLIYSVRPEICRMFGHYEGMVCGQGTNPQYAKINRVEGHKRLKQSLKGEPPVGILTLQITWGNIEKIK